jgi:hypothetical protein
LKEGQKPKKVKKSKMMVKAMWRKRTHYGSISEFVPSPNGKKLQLFLEAKFFCYRWWKYQRITNTPEQERHVQWSPDKTLIYASERGESWDLYTAKVERKEEVYYLYTN